MYNQFLCDNARGGQTTCRQINMQKAYWSQSKKNNKCFIAVEQGYAYCNKL